MKGRSGVVVLVLALVAAVSPAAAQGDLLQKLDVSDPSSFEYLGRSLAVSGDTMVIGCWGDDEGGQDSGAAYVFEFVDGLWVETAKLKADDASQLDLFGITVAIDGDTIAVGAYWDDPRGTNSGSAYVFRREATGWRQLAKLVPSDSGPFDQFSLALAISDGVVIGGSRYVDAVGENSGGAWVFEEVDGAWIERGRIVGNDISADDEFAIEIAMDGSRAILGAFRKDVSVHTDAGAAYIFERRSNGTWGQKAMLVAHDPDEGDWFGISVALEGDRALIGARRDSEAAQDAGAAYVFERAGGAWTQRQKLVAPDADVLDFFGGSVALDGDAMLVGAFLDNDRGEWSGSAYLFRRIDEDWRFDEKLLAPDGGRLDYLGVAAAVTSKTLVVGAPEHDTFPFSDTGAVYVFSFNACRSDVNEDGEVDTLDMLAFLSGWAGGEAEADFNLDGSVNTLDVLQFLNDWNAGC